MNAKRSFLLCAALLLLLLPLGASAQATKPANAIDCGPRIEGADLPPIPVIDADRTTGVLKGTLYTVSEQIKMTTTSAGPGSTPYCYPQWVRAYRKDPPANWNPPSSQLLEPMPGPTLRARVGDVVTLSFFNDIDANKFPGADAGCDRTNVYPANAGDKYPDCFAGSVFTNVHYHGTHTNPNTTGDNVFLNMKPSPRSTDGKNTPLILEKDVKTNFDAFFQQCISELKPASSGPKIWPYRWADLGPDLGKQLLQFVKDYGLPTWYDTNLKQIAEGNWPQYYVGAYPYCFKLPEYIPDVPTSTTSAEVRTPHTHGVGSAEKPEAEDPARPLIMGQAPGTHWYHAHKHGSTTINVSNGMTGVFVIEGEYDDALNAYYGKDWTKSQPVMVIQQLGSVPGLVVGKAFGPGPDFSVNGRLRPTVKMAGNSVQMWRIANTSSRAGTFFSSPTGIQWKQIAQDGVQFKPEIYARSKDVSFLLSSGNRADLLVKAPAYVSGGNNKYPVYVYNTVDPTDRPPETPAAAQLTLVTVEVTQNAPTSMDFIPVDKFPKFPPFLENITDAELTGTKIITFATTGNPVKVRHSIDGKLFDGELGAVVELNRAEEWKIVNETYGPSTGPQISHPFHIHINPFQISELFDPNSYLSTAPGQGTVTVSKPATGNSVVTGTNTAFSSTFNVGDYIWINGAPAGIVASIQSDTQLTLNLKVGAAITTAATYTSAIPMYTTNPATVRPGQCVLDPKDPNTWKPCGPTVPPGERIWWDVFAIPSGGTFYNADGTTTQIPGYFKMRSRFVDYSGYFVIHCHILAHEDRGMMTVVEVAPLQTPYSHH